MLREERFGDFYHRIETALTEYIHAANLEQKNGWQTQAQTFKDLTLRTLEGSYSLLDLKLKLETFCQTLQSKVNIFLDTVVGSIGGPFWTKKVGEFIGAPGSTLKERLLSIANDIAPFDAIYILDEITKAKYKEADNIQQSHQVGMYCVSLFDHEYLSEEGKRILGIIASYNELTTDFITEASKYQHHDIQVSSLIQQFRIHCRSYLVPSQLQKIRNI